MCYICRWNDKTTLMGLINVMKVQCLVAASMIMLSSCSEDTWITSPDGKIRIDFEMSPEGQPTYAVRVVPKCNRAVVPWY